MPAHIEPLELYGYRFRLHRIQGYPAFLAKAAWAGVVGETGAHLLALGRAKVIEIAQSLLTDSQREAFAQLGRAEEHRAIALLAIVQCMRRDRMTAADMDRLARTFVLGHVDIHAGVSDDGHDIWHRIETTDDLDKRLSGEDDGDIWNDLLWRQIPHCLGPTIAASAT